MTAMKIEIAKISGKDWTWPSFEKKAYDLQRKRALLEYTGNGFFWKFKKMGHTINQLRSIVVNSAILAKLEKLPRW